MIMPRETYQNITDFPDAEKSYRSATNPAGRGSIIDHYPRTDESSLKQTSSRDDNSQRSRRRKVVRGATQVMSDSSNRAESPRSQQKSKEVNSRQAHATKLTQPMPNNIINANNKVRIKKSDLQSQSNVQFGKGNLEGTASFFE